MYNGIINVYKEAGYTSFDVVAKLRGILGQKKIGHTGTLDPEATGVLPVVVGNATKLVEYLTDKQKEYIAKLRLGVRTDTLDASGKVLETGEVTCSEDEIRRVIEAFTGDIMQVPPMYSAIKVDGRKLYELAREGKEIERKPRPVTIHEIETLSVIQCTDGGRPTYDIGIRVVCSKGTYIRTLCDDIGLRLGCGAVMTSLVRTMSGAYRIEDALSLSRLQELKDEGCLDEAIQPVDSVFRDYPGVTLSGEKLRLARNGNVLRLRQSGIDPAAEYIRLYDDAGIFFALYELSDRRDAAYKPKTMFLLKDKVHGSNTRYD